MTQKNNNISCLLSYLLFSNSFLEKIFRSVDSNLKTQSISFISSFLELILKINEEISLKYI